LQEEVTQKVIALSIKTAKLDAAVLQKALKIALQQIEKQRGKPKRGKQTMRQLKRSGEQVTNIQNIKAFDPIAKRYDLDYHVKKIEGGEIPRYLVFFKGKDIDSMTEAFREFGAKKLNRDKKPSIRKALAAAKDKAKQLNQSRDKVKNIDRGRAL
jgi:hypothetical protein